MAPPEERPRADFTEGSILGSILKMGLPSMFGFLSQNIYALVDTYWVSRLPEEEAAVAAVTFFSTILWLFFSLNQLVGAGSVAIISRRYGEKNFTGAGTAIKETLILKLSLGLLAGAVGYLLVRDMLVLLGAKELALNLGTQYGRIMFAGMAIPYATYSIYTALRGVANPMMAMVLMIISNILNMVLDPLFIFGYAGLPALGVPGAAVASVTSFGLTLAAGLVIFYGGFANIRLTMRGFTLVRAATMWKMLKIGIPSWLGSLSYTSARLIITPLIAAFGTSVVAAYGVGNQITSFGVMILVGIGLGLSALIGHNVGSGKTERARSTADLAITLGSGLMVILAAMVFVFARPIVTLFFQAPETVAAGTTMLRIFAAGFPFLGAYFIIEGIHTGVGLNSPAMIMSIIHAWLLELVPIFLLTRVWGCPETSIWWTMSIAAALASTAFYLYYRRGRWLRVRL
jgi:putative MATE family efflux protein